MPRFSANGTLLRINYQIDGNTNTQKDRAGLAPAAGVGGHGARGEGRHQRLRAGVRPDDRARLQRDHAVGHEHVSAGRQATASGGRISRRSRSSSSGPRTDDRKPLTKTDTYTAELGGPVLRDRLHFFAGFESTARDLSSASASSRSSRPTRRLLGIGAQPAIFPTEQTARFYIGKGDWTLSPAHHLTARYLGFRNDSPNNPNAFTGLDVDRPGRGLPRRDELDRGAGGVHVRHQQAERAARAVRRTRPEPHAQRAVGHRAGDHRVRRRRVRRAGGEYGRRPASASRRASGRSSTTSPTSAATTATSSASTSSTSTTRGPARCSSSTRSRRSRPTTTRRAGLIPRSYTNFQQFLGDPNFEMQSNLYSVFVQDDWRLTPNVKLLYGVRYDLYDYPEADPAAPFSYSQQLPDRQEQLGSARRASLVSRCGRPSSARAPA